MPELTDANILVTGGAGFVGSHLVDALAEENTVTVVDDLSSGSQTHIHEDAKFVHADITAPDVLAELTNSVDVVFHEAAVVSVTESIDNPPTSHEVNTDATLTLLELARERNFRVVLASSAAIYGHPQTLPISESHSKNPTSPYGLDKLTIDHYARIYHDLYDVETVALRYFNIYGPRQSGEYAGVISIFRDQALAGDDLTIEGDGSQTRDFVHIDDVVDANIAAATTDYVGEAYNIGTGHETRIDELTETIIKVADTSASVTHVTPRAGDIEASVADISKAREKLGFTPSVSLNKGIRNLLTET
ncbi:NAD-dependent epimerase/dehydratase family protein [Halorubrum coriense]|uniref:NAD-dependent epimerase/dehydratase family protein n=1 Tax=Halorubrum coriense TaxID=64713 RepID=UPI0006779355|nr:NAD-dependent epimerase/dehydratase family protein [Halorubrum coriense]